MIQRFDRLQVELPPPSDPDPNGASAVQELMGGRFGEMSTLMNYMFQSINFRGRQKARPFYDLVANIAAEEWGHVELVGATINTMLTGASPIDDGKAPKASLAGVKDARYHHHYLLGGQGALPADSHGKPWSGDYVFSSGDLIEDLTHNYFLETGARSGKLRVYEMVEHPAARALTGYLLVRGGVHQVAYARALERLTGADMTKLFPSPNIPTDEDPRVQAAHQAQACTRSSTASRRATTSSWRPCSTDRTPRPARSWPSRTEMPEGAPWNDLPPQPAVFAPDYAPEDIAEIAAKLREAAGLPKEPTGVVGN